MKSASFKYTQEKGNITIYGKVTLKNDGKVSISLYNAQYHSAFTKNCAKKLAHEIVAADFKHPAASDLQVSNTRGLVKVLKEQTADLKTKFIEKTIEFAKSKFDWAQRTVKMTKEELVAKYGERDLKYPYSAYVDGVYTKITKDLSEGGTKALDEARLISSYGLKVYTEGEVKNAEKHYEDSIENLALRLNQKGIKDDTKMEIETATIGANITTTIKHEGTITKAWTIIAEGVVQRPHYRYLIK